MRQDPTRRLKSLGILNPKIMMLPALPLYTVERGLGGEDKLFMAHDLNQNETAGLNDADNICLHTEHERLFKNLVQG